jgi:hypothetical protein
VSALERLQRDFQAYLLEPARDAVRAEIAGDARVSAETRLGIYADAYRLRLLEALETDFPALKALAGEDEFDRLGRAYIGAFPSRHYSLRWFGRALARFLRDTDPWRERPELAELAEFEWAMTLAFDAADDPAVTIADMAALPPTAWAGMRLQFHPSLQRLDLHWSVPPYWKAVDEKQTPEPPGRSEFPIAWLLWRQELKIYFRSLEVDEAFALDTLRAGGTFADLCQGLCEWLDEPQVAIHAAGLLKRWIGDGLVRRIEA